MVEDFSLRVPDTALEKHFDSVKNWSLLSGVMAEHIDWSVSRCIRYLLKEKKALLN